MSSFRLISRQLPLIASICLCTSAALPACGAPVLQILRGSVQETTYGSAFAEPLTVWVVDSVTHRPVVGARIEFIPGRGVGITPSYAISDDKGLATATATGLEVGIARASAQIAGDAKTRVDFADLQVDKAPLTVVPDNIVSPAGSEIPVVADYSLVGFVNGDTVDSAQITGTPTITTTATNPGMHANYVIKGNPGTLSSPSYSFVAGYGTLAIVGGATSDGWVSSKDATETASLPSDDAPSVRLALAGQRGTDSEELPAFIAGLRGDSGMFVRAAIWSDAAPSRTIIRSQNTRSALLLNLSEAPPTLVPAVRPAALPNVAVMESANVTTMPMRYVDALATPQRSVETAMKSAPVRSAMLPNQSSAVPANSAFSGYSIRKAFVSPASK